MATGLYRDAMKRFAPTAVLEQQALFGWASGKRFEAALAKVADKARAGDVTTDMVLEGLQQLKNEKMGGLGPGVTFTKGKPVTAQDCFYGIQLGTNGYTAPNGAAPTCFDKNGKATQGATDAGTRQSVLAPDLSSTGAAVSSARRAQARRRIRRDPARI